jgi:hypothetical protein
LPLYRIETKVGECEEAVKPRLVEAKSELAALKHVASERFAIETISKPADVAAMMAAEVKLEKVTTE